MAEEQLTALNAYMAKATNAYQIEIMRLRKALSSGKRADAVARNSDLADKLAGLKPPSKLAGTGARGPAPRDARK
jgi:hypothetical protein